MFPSLQFAARPIINNDVISRTRAVSIPIATSTDEVRFSGGQAVDPTSTLEYKQQKVEEILAALEGIKSYEEINPHIYINADGLRRFKEGKLAPIKHLVQRKINGKNTPTYKKVEEALNDWINGIENPHMQEEVRWRIIEHYYGKEIIEQLEQEWEEMPYIVPPGATDDGLAYVVEAITRDISEEAFQAICQNGLQDLLDNALKRKIPELMTQIYDNSDEAQLLNQLRKERRINPYSFEYIGSINHYGSPEILLELEPYINSENSDEAKRAVNNLSWIKDTSSKAVLKEQLIKRNAESVTDTLIQMVNDDTDRSKTSSVENLAKYGVGEKTVEQFIKLWNKEDGQLDIMEYFVTLLNRDLPTAKEAVITLQPEFQEFIQKERGIQSNNTDPFLQSYAEEVLKKLKYLEAALLSDTYEDPFPDQSFNPDNYNFTEYDHLIGWTEELQTFQKRIDATNAQIKRGIVVESPDKIQNDLDKLLINALNKLVNGFNKEGLQAKDLFSAFKAHNFVKTLIHYGSKDILPTLEKVVNSPWDKSTVKEHLNRERALGFVLAEPNDMFETEEGAKKTYQVVIDRIKQREGIE